MAYWAVEAVVCICACMFSRSRSYSRSHSRSASRSRSRSREDRKQSRERSQSREKSPENERRSRSRSPSAGNEDQPWWLMMMMVSSDCLAGRVAVLSCRLPLLTDSSRFFSIFFYSKFFLCFFSDVYISKEWWSTVVFHLTAVDAALWPTVVVLSSHLLCTCNYHRFIDGIPYFLMWCRNSRYYVAN